MEFPGGQAGMFFGFISLLDKHPSASERKKNTVRRFNLHYLQKYVSEFQVKTLSLKVHMHKILYFVFKIFLASFNNRLGRGQELQKIC
jgi:hypothetical protein